MSCRDAATRRGLHRTRTTLAPLSTAAVCRPGAQRQSLSETKAPCSSSGAEPWSYKRDRHNRPTNAQTWADR